MSLSFAGLLLLGFAGIVTLLRLRNQKKPVARPVPVRVRDSSRHQSL